MTDFALFYLMTKQISFSKKPCYALCDACVFKVPVFDVKFLNGLGDFLIVKFIVFLRNVLRSSKEKA